MAAYPFVPAPDHWARATPIRAIAIHMAEGGGTVSWLQRPDGNSSHYVVEYTGRIVQMVREDRAAGSINPNLLRRNDDASFTYLGETITYGVTAAREALGPYWNNPNSAVIAIEVEGFARNGPNDKQRIALKSLVSDIRTRHTGLPCLGHRDFQNYKACPGKLIPWVDYGGHGPEVDVPVTTITPVLPAAYGTVTSSGNVDIWTPDGIRKTVTLEDFPCDAVEYSIAQSDNSAPKGSPWRRLAAKPHAGYYVAGADVTYEGPPPVSGDTTHRVTLRVDDNVVADLQV